MDILLSMMLLWSLEFSKQVKSHLCFKSPYPVRKTLKWAFFLSGSWEWVIFGAQAQLCLDALSDTTNDPVVIRTTHKS